MWLDLNINNFEDEFILHIVTISNFYEVCVRYYNTIIHIYIAHYPHCALMRFLKTVVTLLNTHRLYTEKNWV